MITETGRVVAVESDCVWVETIRKSTCSSCSAQKGCGYGLLNETAHLRKNRLRVLTGQSSPHGISVNDVVQISIPEHVLVKGALLVYILPLLFMLLASFLMSWLGGGDGASLLAALAGLLLGFAWVRWRSNCDQYNPDQQPVLIVADKPLSVCVQVQ